MPAAMRTLIVGTDCSGMETPVMALQNLGVPVDHAFSCDVNRNVKATIMANFPPRVWYDDVSTRNNATAPKCDLYVAGFPCQPFSSAGKQQGFSDWKGRGTVFFDVLQYIRQKEPTVFVLENVVNLCRLQGGQYFQDIMDALKSVGKYNLSTKILNTRENGIPQNRQRLYIVGIRKNADQGTFEWPEPVPVPSIEAFLEPRKRKPTKNDLPPKTRTVARANVKEALRRLTAEGRDPLKEPWVVDIDSSTYRMKYMYDRSMCMTAGRPEGHWITNRGRRMTTLEMLRLQGIQTPEEGFKIVVSPLQLGRQVGNAMSVNVLERLFVRLLPAAGLVPAGSLRDRWASMARRCANASPKKSVLSKLALGLKVKRSAAVMPKKRKPSDRVDAVVKRARRA